MASRYVFDPPAWPALPVAGSELLFPVRRIYCVGRNYAAHAREMGHDPDREPPFFFMKPADAVVPLGGEVRYPPATANLHHEIELVAAVGRGGAEIPIESALAHVCGYAIGVDLTRRDLQDEAKRLRRPWDMSKGFDQSAPCSALHPAERIGHPAQGAIRLAVNGTVRQSGDLAQMIWSTAEIVSHLSGLVRLEPGDLIMTGTPDGVGPVARGDRVEGEAAGVDRIGFVLI
jgi:fumarylpyruvate hydrolase